jgi:hypothetical protein
VAEDMDVNDDDGRDTLFYFVPLVTPCVVAHFRPRNLSLLHLLS